MSDSKDKGLHSYYGAVGVGGYNYNTAGGYGGYPAYAGGYPPVAYPYPLPSGYPPPQAACPGYHHHHPGHGGLGAFLGAVAAGYMMPHRNGHTHGGYVTHGGHYGGYGYGGYPHGKFKHGKYKHGKFGKHGGFRKWK